MMTLNAQSHLAIPADTARATSPQPVVRADKSGTTSIFTAGLAAFSTDWAATVGAG